MTKEKENFLQGTDENVDYTEGKLTTSEPQKEAEKRCKRCGESETDAKKYISPCCNFEKVYTKHLF